MARCVVVAWLLCAWVLWAAPRDLSAHWPLGGWQTRDECDREAKRRNLDAAKAATGAAHLCLPDTIDPRAPSPRPR